MNIRDWDEVLKFLDVLTRWPAVVLYLAFLFRGAIAKKLSGIEKIKVKDAEVIFAKLKETAASLRPELLQQVILKLPLDAIIDDATETGDEKASEDAAPSSEVDEEGAEARPEQERVELEMEWRSLRKEKEETE